jgi:hypothetical protein
MQGSVSNHQVERESMTAQSGKWLDPFAKVTGSPEAIFHVARKASVRYVPLCRFHSGQHSERAREGEFGYRVVIKAAMPTWRRQ